MSNALILQSILLEQNLDTRWVINIFFVCLYLFESCLSDKWSWVHWHIDDLNANWQNKSQTTDFGNKKKIYYCILFDQNLDTPIRARW